MSPLDGTGLPATLRTVDAAAWLASFGDLDAQAEFGGDLHHASLERDIIAAVSRVEDEARSEYGVELTGTLRALSAIVDRLVERHDDERAQEAADHAEAARYGLQVRGDYYPAIVRGSGL